MIIVTFIVGIILGPVLLIATVYVYIKHRRFGLGGVVLTVFGTILIGLSIWQSVELTIGPKGDFSAKFKQDLGAAAADINNRIAKLELKLTELTEDIASFRDKFPVVKLSQEILAARANKEHVFQENSKYSVLIFYKSQNKQIAEDIEKTLLSDGYRSSSTATDLTEAIKQFPPKSAWIIYTKNGEKILNDVKEKLRSLNLGISLNIEPQAVKLGRGDIQILLF